MMAMCMPRWLSKTYLKFNWKYQRAHRFTREWTKKIIKQEQNKKYEIENQQSKNRIAPPVTSLNEQANDQQISSNLTQSEIFDEILMIILAGHSSTPTTLAWLILYMSKHSRVQQRIRDELREHNILMTDSFEYPPSLILEKLDSVLVYCECVIKEVHLSVVIKLYLLLYIMSIDSRYWHHADPTKFVPEQFLAEDKNHHPYAMLSFLGGHRACIGQDLAWFQFKLIIVRLMQRGVAFEDTPKNTGGNEVQCTCHPKHLALRVRIGRSEDTEVCLRR